MIRRHNETPMLPMMRISAAIGIALLAIVAIPATMGLSLAQNASDGEASGSGPDDEAAEAQRKRIQQETATLKQHPWAGDYYEGDGLGANIRISLAPEAGIAATWHGCLGLYGANRGKVVQRDGVLRFEYEQPNQEGFGGFPDALRPVRWGERRYLISETKLIDFVNAINHGFEPRDQVHGMYLLADGDEKRPVAGLPELPGPMLDLIRRRPLEVRVVSVDAAEKRKSKTGSDCGFHYRMTLDGGARDGLAPGVELKVIGQTHVWDDVTVRTAADATATAEMGIWSVDCTRPKSAPVAGWRLSTGAYAEKPAVAR